MIPASLVTQHPPVPCGACSMSGERRGPLPNNWIVTRTACNTAVRESSPVPVSLTVLPPRSCTLSIQVRVYRISSPEASLLHVRPSSVASAPLSCQTLLQSSKIAPLHACLSEFPPAGLTLKSLLEGKSKEEASCKVCRTVRTWKKDQAGCLPAQVRMLRV